MTPVQQWRAFSSVGRRFATAAGTPAAAGAYASRGRGCMETGGAGAAVGLEGGEVGEVKSVEMSSLIRGRSSRAGEGECLMFYFLNGAQSWRAPAEQRQGSDVNACTGPTTSSCFPCQQDGTWHRQLGSHLGNQIRHMDRPSIVPCQSHTHPYHPLEQSSRDLREQELSKRDRYAFITPPRNHTQH
jgi:hypothetical protein